jgi:hypothetical protein
MRPANWDVTEDSLKKESKKTREFMSELNRMKIKTATNSKYYMPGDSEMRAYFFMQVVYGEGEGNYPVRNGILVDDSLYPSLLMKGVSRPVLKLDEMQKEMYLKCDGKHKVDAHEFEQYPYMVNYKRIFK